MKSSLISIIIPVFNRAKLLPETLDSVLRQIYIEKEYIFVDDGSNDNTIEVIEQYVKKDNMFKLYYYANQEIIRLLTNENKFTKNLENFFYISHKRVIADSRKLGYDVLAEKFILLLEIITIEC